MNADGLQKEMLKVRNSTKELKAENGRLKASMEKLAMQGKLQSKEYKELDAQFKANNRTISENGEKLRLLESRLSNTNKSYAQLSKQAKQLRRELDNTVKSLQPQEYARLEAELAKTKEAMEQLKPKTEAVKESFFSLTRMKAAVIGFFAGIGASAGAFFMNSISNAREWMKEGIRLAANADGVRRAFDRLDRPGMLSELRKATKGTVNDLELMQAAVKAKDFRIPLQDLGKYLQFAQLKAQQTGQSVEYLTNSIVTGLGRKSLLILDNLGLSATEINEEMAKTGDLMTAVANIVDKQLAQAGENYVSAADKAAQKAAELQNRQMEIGKLLLPLQEKWSTLFQTVKLGFSGVAVWILEHKRGIITLVSVITGFIVVYKTVILLQKAWNGVLMLGKAINLAYASVIALQEGNMLRSAAAMKVYNASVASNNVIVKACTASTYLFAAAKAVLTGNINKARIAIRAFNAIAKISPLGMIVTLLGVATAGFLALGSKMSAAGKSIREFNKELYTQQARLNDLFEKIKKTNAGTSERTELVKELSRQYPDLIGNYNLEAAKLEEITQAQNRASAALTNRIATEMKAKAVGDFIGENISRQLDIVEYLMAEAYSQMGKDVYSKLESSMKSFLNDSSKDLQDFWGTFGKYFRSTLSNDELTSFRDAFFTLRDTQKGLSTGIDEISRKYAPYLKLLRDGTRDVVEEQKDLVQAKKEEIAQTEREIASTPELLAAKNKKLAKLNEELKALQNLGVVQKNPDDFASQTDRILSALSDRHEKELLKLRQAKEQQGQTEAQYNKDVLAEDRRYYARRLEALKNLEKTTARTKLKTLADIQAKMTESSGKLLEIARKQDENEISLLQEQRDKKLSVQEAGYKSAKTQIELDYANQRITQQQRDMLLLSLEESNSRERLGILKEYQGDVEALELQTGNVKAQAVKVSGQKVLEAELANAKDRAAQQKAIESLLSSFKKEFSLTNLPDETQLQLKVLEASYQARLELIRSSLRNELITKEQAAAQEKALEEANNTAKLNIAQDAENRKNGILEKYGLLGFQQRYSMQMAALKREKEQGLIDAEEYAKAEKMIKLQAWKEAFDYYSNLFGNAVAALQDAEIANMEAKYDAEIAAAQGNAQEVERLETEKAQKKLDIEKKYADVQFAVKASQIIADTAVAIMKALSQLGPIAGPIAAALMGVTGYAQLAAANAERQKVKSMTLSGAAGSTPVSAERVVKGYDEGGYTGPGGRYEVAGVVHRGEYVVPMPEMKNKRVVNMVKVIESIRRNRTTANPWPGYYEGGKVDRQDRPQKDLDRLTRAAEKLEEASRNLSRPAKSYVLLSDINAAEDLRRNSERPFTRTDK